MCSKPALSLCIKISVNLFANHSPDSETNLLLLWGVSLCLCSLQEPEDSVSNGDTGHPGHPVSEGGALFHHVGTMAKTAGRIKAHVAQALLRRSPRGGLWPGPASDSPPSGLATPRPKLDRTWREGARATPPRRRICRLLLVPADLRILSETGLRTRPVMPLFPAFSVRWPRPRLGWPMSAVGGWQRQRKVRLPPGAPPHL